MATEITCITKTDRTSAHERISHVGGYGWYKTQGTVISEINMGYDYYTFGGGKRAKVIVAKNDGREYLKTENDGVQPNNLLSLPSCR